MAQRKILKHRKFESKRIEKDFFLLNTNQKKAKQKSESKIPQPHNPCIVILILDKIDFKTENITRDKDGHFRMIKYLIQL